MRRVRIKVIVKSCVYFMYGCVLNDLGYINHLKQYLVHSEHSVQTSKDDDVVMMMIINL
jgi:hypothetical protein